MADTSMEGNSYSALERFLIWFVIPFVFTAVLLFVLLSIFDYDIKSSIQKALHNTPVIGSIVPAPKEKSVVTGSGKAQTAEESAKSKDEEISKLNTKVADLEAALKKSDSTTEQKDQSLKDSEAKIADLEEKLKSKTQTEEEYNNQITQLANLYGKMTPSKAAPIMENLTPKEMVLVFSMMKAENRAPILEKMDAKKAAEATIGLKDVIPVRDKQIAALQERLALNGVKDTTKGSTSVSKADLGQTFANMTPKSAANVILEMNKSNPDKVLAILSGMDNASRSKVMSSLSDANKETAAAITAKLAQ
ncbi:MotE family protein [Paenibacillus sp. SI8]|uniref:MotE family protein n=1 Tax=unclassified Paenibacillus TaxID=185978 RepID=UPI0034679C0C